MTRFGELNNSMSIGSGVSTQGNTAGTTGTVSGQLILVGGTNITLSQSTNATGATVSIVAGAGGAGDGVNIVAAGTQTANTTGTVLFDNSNGITFGMSNSSVITASHNGITSQTNQTVGGYVAGNTSGTSSGTFDARSLSISVQGSLTADMTNGRINLSAPNALTTAMQSGASTQFVQANANFNGTNASGTVARNNISVSVNAQSNQSIGIYGAGNTSGTSSGTADARSLSVSVQGSLTVDVTNGRINLSAPNALTTAMASNRGTDFVQANANFNGTNASGTIASNNISVSVNAQSNQSIGIYGSSQTTGQSSSSTYDARSLTIRGAGAISVGNSGGEIIISGDGGAQSNQTIGIYGSGNTSGTSSGTLDARSLTLRAYGSLTVDMTDGRINLSAPNALTTAMASNRGTDFVQANAVFNGTNASGTIASDNISVSVANQTNQSVGLYGEGNTSGTSSATADARSLSFNAGSGISIDMTNNKVNFSVQPPIRVGVSTMGNTAGSTGTVIRSYVLVGTNAVSLSQSTAAGGAATVTINAPTQTVQTQNMVSVLGSTGDISFANGNNVTFGGNASTVTASASFNQTNQSIGVYGSNNTSGTSSGTLDARSLTIQAQGSLTVDMTNGRINLSAPNALTTAMASNRGTNFVQANAVFNGTNASGTIASNNISVSVSNQSNQSVGLYASSQTTGQSSSSTVDARSLNVRGAGIVSVGMSGGELIVSATAAGGPGAGLSAGLSNIGNTSGDTGLVSNRLVFAGGNNITLSQSTNGDSGTITIQGISYANSNNITFGTNAGTLTASFNPINIGMSNIGNTAGTSGTVDGAGAQFVFVGSGEVTLSQSIDGQSVTLTIDKRDQTWNSHILAPMNMSQPFAQSSISLGQNSLYIYPVKFDDYVYADHLKLPAMVTHSSSAASSGQKGQTFDVAFYSRVHTDSGNTGYTQLTRHWSSSYTIAVSMSSNASIMLSMITGIGNSTSYNSLTASSAGLNLSASLHGPRYAVIPVSSTMSTGEWWFAVRNSTSSAGTAGNILNISNLAVAMQTFGQMGVSTNATGVGFHKSVGMGTYSATTGAFPATINMTQINQAGTGPIAYLVTGTN